MLLEKLSQIRFQDHLKLMELLKLVNQGLKTSKQTKNRAYHQPKVVLSCLSGMKIFVICACPNPFQPLCFTLTLPLSIKWNNRLLWSNNLFILWEFCHNIILVNKAWDKLKYQSVCHQGQCIYCSSIILKVKYNIVCVLCYLLILKKITDFECACWFP